MMADILGAAKLEEGLKRARERLAEFAKGAKDIEATLTPADFGINVGSMTISSACRCLCPDTVIQVNGEPIPDGLTDIDFHWDVSSVPTFTFTFIPVRGK